MKIELSSMGNGSGLSTLLWIKSDYNPQNKIFNKNFGTIEEDDFIDCFPTDKQDKIIEQLGNGKYIFDVPKEILTDKAKQLFYQ